MKQLRNNNGGVGRRRPPGRTVIRLKAPLDVSTTNGPSPRQR